MSWVIGRPINGITINGLEYVLDKDGNELLFDSEDDARDWLYGCGYTDNGIEEEGIMIIEAEADDE